MCSVAKSTDLERKPLAVQEVAVAVIPRIRFVTFRDRCFTLAGAALFLLAELDTYRASEKTQSVNVREFSTREGFGTAKNVGFEDLFAPFNVELSCISFHIVRPCYATVVLRIADREETTLSVK